MAAKSRVIDKKRAMGKSAPRGIAERQKRRSNAARRRRLFFQGFTFFIFRSAAAINGLALLVIIYFLVANGWQAINWTFLTQAPRDSMTAGGNSTLYRRDALSCT